MQKPMKSHRIHCLHLQHHIIHPSKSRNTTQLPPPLSTPNNHKLTHQLNKIHHPPTRITAESMDGEDGGW